MKIRKNDLVKILLGKDRGKTAKVLRIFSKKGKVLVEGVNVSKRHIRKTGQSEGGILEISKPVGISNLALVCSACQKPARVGYKKENQNKLRVCKKCQEVINYA